MGGSSACICLSALVSSDLALLSSESEEAYERFRLLVSEA